MPGLFDAACWAVELVDAADVAEWNANDPGNRDVTRTLLMP
jgi:hypothetical protein